MKTIWLQWETSEETEMAPFASKEVAISQAEALVASGAVAVVVTEGFNSLIFRVGTLGVGVE